MDAYSYDQVTGGVAAQMSAMTLQPHVTESPLLAVFREGNIVQLQCQNSGCYLRIVNGNVDGSGASGQHAQFIVHVRKPAVVALQNVADPKRWLAIAGGKTVGTGNGGPFCELLIGELDGRFVVLESGKNPGQRIGVTPEGKIKLAYNVGMGQDSKLIPVQHTPPTAQSFPPYATPTYPPPSTLHATSVGNSPVLTCFSEGNIIFLHSKSCNRNLRITQMGVVEGLGGSGRAAQFTVHVRRQGVASLQNVANPSHWLCVEGGLTRSSNGGISCEFYVKDLDGQHVALESVISPGQHVGLLPNGTVKLPHQTHTGPHGRFIPSVYYKNPQNVAMATSTVVTPDTTSPSAPYPPDPVSAYPPNPVSAYPPDPVSAYPLYPVSAYPLNPVSAYHPDPVLTTANPPPTNPTPDVCSGSAIAKVPDQKQTLPAVFANGCSIRLRCNSTGRNLRIKRGGMVDGLGGEGRFALFVVLTNGDVVRFQSTADPSHWLRVTDKGLLDGKGHGGRWTEFRVKLLNDGYVALESVSFPNWHVGVLPSGESKAANITRKGPHGQFYPYN